MGSATRRGAAILCGAAALLQLAGWASAAGDPLARYRWDKRLLVVFAPNEAEPGLARQRSLLADVRRGAADRDLVAIEVVGDAVHGPGAEWDAAALRARFAVPPKAFKVVLVGKDGDPKFSSSVPIAASALFGRIDAMPMRREGLR